MGGIPPQTLSPTTRAAITHHFDISPATILAANLHAGLLTEYTWPELENRWVGVDKRPAITLWESYPGVIVATPDRIAYIENNTTVSEHDHVDTNSDAGQIAVGENILTIRYVAGTIGFNAEWATGVPQPLNLHQWQHGHYELSTNTLLIPAGRLYGGGIARHADAAATDVPGTEITMPEGNAFGDNHGHAWHTVLRKDPWSETYAIRQVNPETGRALGPSQPEALRSLERTTATPIDWGAASNSQPASWAATTAPTTRNYSSGRNHTTHSYCVQYLNLMMALGLRMVRLRQAFQGRSWKKWRFPHLS